MLEIKISCACVINRLVNISIQLFRSKYVRIRLQTSTSSFFKNSEKPTVNFGSYIGNITTGIFLNLDGNLPMNIKLEQRRDLGRNQGPWKLFLEKCELLAFSAAGLYEGSNRGEYLGTFSSSLVCISGFGHWRNQLRT